MRRQTKIELLGLLAPAIGFLAQPALADPETITQSIIVRYSDLNLATPEGAQTLYGRIEQAARKVCGSESDGGRFLTPGPSYSACFRKAVDDAVNHVNRPTLTALHRQGPGHTKPKPREEQLAQQGDRR